MTNEQIIAKLNSQLENVKSIKTYQLPAAAQNVVDATSQSVSRIVKGLVVTALRPEFIGMYAKQFNPFWKPVDPITGNSIPRFGTLKGASRLYGYYLGQMLPSNALIAAFNTKINLKHNSNSKAARSFAQSVGMTYGNKISGLIQRFVK